MSRPKSPFEVLQISETASDFEIRSAWRRRVREAHPDQGGSVEGFLEVQAAYRILTDPDLRARLATDPHGLLEEQVSVERRRAQLRRRRARLSRLYE